MLKKILLTIILFSGLSAFASDNYLNSVVISKNDDKTSIVLRTDEITKVKKEVEASDKIVVTLKGITQAPSVNTLYKNISDVKGLVIQSENNGELKIYVEAPDIANADVVFETPNSAPITVINKINEEKAVWSIISIALLLFIMGSAKNMVSKPVKQPELSELIKEREKTLYKNFQKEVASVPSINYKLKGYRKHVLKGETIRSYESRMSKI
jgi:hypothetical protein